MSTHTKFATPSESNPRIESAELRVGADAASHPGFVNAPSDSDAEARRAAKAAQKSLWNTDIMGQALIDSVRKLDPRWMVKNPVMMVVEVGSVLTTVLLIDNVLNHRPGFAFNLQITLWLWFTVLFANFAEAMAEGRGK